MEEVRSLGCVPEGIVAYWPLATVFPGCCELSGCASLYTSAMFFLITGATQETK